MLLKEIMNYSSNSVPWTSSDRLAPACDYPHLPLEIPCAGTQHQCSALSDGSGEPLMIRMKKK